MVSCLSGKPNQVEIFNNIVIFKYYVVVTSFLLGYHSGSEAEDNVVCTVQSQHFHNYKKIHFCIMLHICLIRNTMLLLSLCANKYSIIDVML